MLISDGLLLYDFIFPTPLRPISSIARHPLPKNRPWTAEKQQYPAVSNDTSSPFANSKLFFIFWFFCFDFKLESLTLKLLFAAPKKKPIESDRKT
ncbi:hypothetical protein H5410_044771 [Solanum commersonii]|uniref:Uncharacterized protein n=1 Tax=Solanum commersonii TaxID=4109 RepID=A0A9J5X7Q4_SOLCO|nr:hypothetical protein H5410_044771 [Solanum commersonii]